ncbi:hypothetical protein J2847_006414, partial [Azospirillum agricola]|nr:hypothetical protein [Azospirillum agricola]
MTSQVESLSVGYEDNASAAANTSAQAIRRVGEEALATEAKVTRASRSGAQLARAFGDAERLAARLTAATRPYRQALEDLERSELSLAEKERLRVSILAQQDAAVQRVTAQHEKLMAGLRASEAAATAQAAGMAAATAAAGSWSGAMASVYAAAGSVTTGINGTVHALQLLNADFRTGHAGFAEWSAAAKGLEASLRGVSAAQKAINDATGISRQTVNTATIGPLKHAVTGTAAPTGNTLGLVTGDASATAARLADLEA